MLIYILLLIILFIVWLFWGEGRGEERKATWLMFALMALAMSLRGLSVGTDTQQAAILIEQAACSSLPSGFDQLIGIYEYAPLYAIWCKFIWFVYPSSQVVIAANSIVICLGFSLFFLQVSEKPSMCSFLYYVSFSFVNALNVMRQELACAVCLIALVLLLRNKRISALVVAVVAFGIHNTSIALVAIFALLYVLSRKIEMSFGKLLLICLSISAILRALYEPAYSLFFSVFDRYGDVYSEDALGYTSQGRTVLLYMLYLLVFVVYSLSAASDKNRTMQGPILLITSLGLICLGFNIFFYDLTLMKRIANYFLPFLLVVLSRVLTTLCTQWRTVAPSYFVTTFIALVFLVQLHSNIGEVVPYSFFWD